MRGDQAAIGAVGTMRGQLAPTVTTTDLINVWGGTGSLAAELSGTSDRKAPSFKAAQRELQRLRAAEGKAPKGGTQERHASTRRPAASGKGAGYGPKLEALRDQAQEKANEKALDAIARRGFNYVLEGEIWVSNDLSERHIEGYVPPDAAAELVAALRAGESERIEEALIVALLVVSYPMGQAGSISFEDVRALDMSLGDGSSEPRGQGYRMGYRAWAGRAGGRGGRGR